MKAETRYKLFAAWAWCDMEDKSTEFMIEFMKDEAQVDHDCVINLITSTSDDIRMQWYNDNPNWYEKWKEDHTL